MPPSWLSRRAAVRQAIDANFGEEVRVKPMRTTQYDGAEADPARAEVVLIGKLHLKNEQTRSYNPSSSSRNDFDRFPDGDATLYVDPDVYPAVRSVKKADRIFSPVRCMEFEVMRIDPRIGQRTLLRLAII